MSSKVERIIEMSKKLTADRSRVAREKQVLERTKEKARVEKEQAKEKANNEQCAGILKATGVIEIFEELQNCFPGSEVLWGCEGSRVSLVMPGRRLTTYKEVIVESFNDFRDDGYREYSDHYKHITVRAVSEENCLSHVQDEEKGARLNFEPINVDGRTEWLNRRYGVYIGNEWVEDIQDFDELIANKLSLLDDILKTLPRRV